MCLCILPQGKTFKVQELKPPKWKTTQMEDNPNGRRPKWKTTKMEEDQNGKQPKWKTTKKEERKATKIKDDQNRSRQKSYAEDTKSNILGQPNIT